MGGSVEYSTPSITLSYVDNLLFSSCPIRIIRTFTAIDSSNRTDTATQNLSINDDIATSASNPEAISVQCISNVPPQDRSVVIDETDNCSIPSVVFVSEILDGTSCPIVITRTYRIIDECGNSIDVVQIIIINDEIVPQLISTLEPNITISCGEIPEVPTLEFIDNCTSNVTVDFGEIIVPITSTAYTLIRTWTVTDDCSNQIIFNQEITKEDCNLSTDDYLIKSEKKIRNIFNKRSTYI